jgi:hypothetical protein
VKRLILALALGAGLLAGCSESETFATAAGISGAYDLTLVDRLVFVTSSDTDELRVLDLDSEPRGYVRAPNPLEPLAIPVLDRPLALARDVQYNANGQEVAGPYVYARSAGSQEISVVGAAPEQLREFKRLVAPGIVTAFAGRGPATEGGASQLYFATQSAEGARVWRQELPAPEALEASTLPAPVLAVQLPPGETVQALLVLPAANQLAVSTRSGAGRSGRSFRLDTTAPGQLVELRFGAPVRQLYTHPTVRALPPRNGNPEVVLTAGTRIYGILDEAACGGQQGCSGVLAVDSASGQVSRVLIPTDIANRQIGRYVQGPEMVPIRVGNALPTGMTIAPNAQLLVVEPVEDRLERLISPFPLLGIVPASDGRIILFDAVELRHFDFDPEAALSVVELRNAAEQTKPTTTGRLLLTADVVNGATMSDIYRVIYQSRLQGLAALSRPAGTGTNFDVPPSDAALAGVQQGDIIVLEGGSTPCTTELAIAQVIPGTASTTLVTSTPVPEACADASSFTVRAGGAQPFVVFSASRGVVGRLGTGQPFTVEAPYLRYPDAQTPPTPPVQVRLTLSGLESGLTRDDRYVVATEGRFVPYIVEVNRSDATLNLSEYRLPASVVFTRAGDEDTDFAYLAYPSADGILQMNLELLYFDQLNDAGLRTFQ